MIKNYFITVFRNLFKNKVFSVVNIIGLSIGIAACLLISLYVNYELSFDRHVEDIDQLYRVIYSRETESGEKVEFASASPITGPAITEKFPEITKFGRAFKVEGIISIDNISFKEEKMFWAEPTFLELFSFEFIIKDGDSLLSEPNTAVISEKIARKYFGDQNPVGKSLKKDGNELFKIVGVFKNLPENTHFSADILLPYKNWERILGDRIQFGWVYSGFYTYVKVKPGTSVPDLNNKIRDFINTELGEYMEYYKMKISYQLQPVKDIHLTSHFMHELGHNGNKNSVLFLYIIAWFIIIIAWINFVNLLTISSIKRTEEIGLRKVLGSTSRQLISQFLLESLVINNIALLLAFAIIEGSFSVFSKITGISSYYVIWNKLWFWKNVLIIFSVGTLLAGSYPIWGILSKKIVVSLKGSFTGSKRSVILRKALVIFQFFMAVVLISGTIAVYIQLQHLHSKETGINKDNILVINTPRVGNEELQSQRKAFKEEIRKYPSVQDITFSSVIPGKHNMFNRGGVRRINDDPTSGKNYRITEVDHHFMDVYSNTFLVGRNFSEDKVADEHAVIVNYTASKLLGFEKPEDALGEKIIIRQTEDEIIGVIQDFHQESPRNEFEPQIFRLALRFDGYFSVKLATGDNLKKVQKSIEAKYNEFFPGNPFEYFYLDDFYAQQYKSEVRFGKVFGFFSLLALFITLLGILSLSSFSAAQRKKEIGIRKVMGASTNQILVLLSTNYIFLLAVAFLLSVPVINYALEQWLNNFATRMEISAWIFLIPIIVVSVFSLITVVYQSVKTAKDNPVNSLRYE